MFYVITNSDKERIAKIEQKTRKGKTTEKHDNVNLYANLAGSDFLKEIDETDEENDKRYAFSQRIVYPLFKIY